MTPIEALMRLPGKQLEAKPREGPALENASTSEGPALVLAFGLAAGLAGQGGYRVLSLAIMAVSSLLAAAMSMRRAAPPTRTVALAQVSLMAFGIWALLRGWSIHAASGALWVTVTCVSAAAALHTTARMTRRERLILVDGLLLAGAAIGMSGYIAVLLRSEPWAMLDAGVWRASTALTYPNAAGGLLAPLSVIALARCGSESRPRATPGLATVLLISTAATLSRGAFLGLLLGILVLGALTRGRFAPTALGPLTGAGVALVGLAPLVQNSSTAPRALGAAALSAGLALSLWLGNRRIPGRLPRRLTIAAACLVVLTALAASSGLIAQRAADLRATSSQARLSELATAWQLHQSEPWLGVGVGQGRLTWYEPGDPWGYTTLFVHNEYVQVLLDLGWLGAGILACALVMLAAIPLRRPRGEPTIEMWAGICAALAAFCLQSGLDFLWHLPALPLTMIALAGVTAPLGRLPLVSSADLPISPPDARGHPGIGGRLSGGQ